jgi:hypothetical protein
MGWQAQTDALGAAEMIPAHANPERSSGSTISVFGRCAFFIDHSVLIAALSADLVGT